MSTARQSDWWILGSAIAVVIGLLITLWPGCLNPSFVQNAVLSGTALIILWYTVETTRLRREAEGRAKRDREPLIHFEVQQYPKERSSSVQGTGQMELPRQGGKYPLRFGIVNHSANPALACVRTRLKVNTQVGTFPQDSDYGGGVVWQVTPFFNLLGWFDLIELVENAQDKHGRDAWPETPLVLAVQVDVYWPNRQFLRSLAREYHVRIEGQKGNVEFWPLVNVQSIGVLECPQELPAELTVRGPVDDSRS